MSDTKPVTGKLLAGTEPELGLQEVHVWEISLAPPGVGADRDSLNWDLLNPEEKNKAQRFHFEKDRYTYALSRIVMKTILAAYSGHDPKDIHFTHNSHGKPALPAALNTRDLRFNLTHSRDLALFALSRSVELGIDIEYMRSERSFLKLAHRFFSPSEHQNLEALTADSQIEAFYRCWTRKEAFIKAVGLGLAFPLNKFGVSIEDDSAELLWADESLFRGRCFLNNLATRQNYCASLASLEAPVSIQRYQWSSTVLKTV